MDDLDRQLVSALREEPRATARALSRSLGVGEPAVAARIRRLQEDRELRVMALLEMGALGYEHFALFGIRVDDRLPDVVAKELIEIPEVQGLTATSGRFELTGTLFARDKPHLRALLDERLGAVRGVQDVESALVLEALVSTADIATLKGEGTALAWPEAGDGLPLLDPLDRGIVTSLQEDGRMSYRELGRRHATPEATIRSRMRRLESNDSLRLRAVTNVELTESQQASAWVGLRARGASIESIAQQLSKMEEIGFLGTTLGRFNLTALLVLPSRAALLDFIFERIAPLRGIQRLETWEVVRSYKHDIRVSIRTD